MASQVLAAGQPSVGELLNKYAQTQGKLKSFICKSETVIEASGYRDGIYKEVKKYVAVEMRSDGDRVKMIRRLWGDIGSIRRDLPKEDAVYTSHMWDGKNFYQYGTNLDRSRSPRLAIGKTKFNKRRRARNLSLLSTDPLVDYVGTKRGKKRIDAIIRDADEVRVRDRTERIGESDCYVIDATTKYGKFTLWIDPQHGHNIAQSQVVRGEGDFSGAGVRLAKGVELYGMKTVIRFEAIDGAWVAMEAVRKGSVRTPTQNSAIKEHYKRTAFILNPDHDRLGSFLTDDIANGTTVQFMGIPRVPGVRYRWQNGKVLDEKSRVVYGNPDQRPSSKRESKGD